MLSLGFSKLLFRPRIDLGPWKRLSSQSNIINGREPLDPETRRLRKLEAQREWTARAPGNEAVRWAELKAKMNVDPDFRKSYFEQRSQRYKRYMQDPIKAAIQSQRTKEWYEKHNDYARRQKQAYKQWLYRNHGSTCNDLPGKHMYPWSIRQKLNTTALAVTSSDTVV